MQKQKRHNEYRYYLRHMTYRKSQILFIVIAIWCNSGGLNAKEFINNANVCKFPEDSIENEIVGLFNRIDTVNIQDRKIWYYGKKHSQLYFKKQAKLVTEMQGSRVKPEYEYSNNIQLIYLIYSYYSNLDSNLSYDLVDKKTKEVLYDLRFSPTTISNGFIKKEWVNIDKTKEVYQSYSLWIKMLQKHGLKYLQEHNISPLNYCDVCLTSDQIVPV